MRSAVAPLAALSLLAAGCAESPVAPSRALLPQTAAFAIFNTIINFPGGESYPAGLEDGIVLLCKTGDAAGTFDFQVSVNGAAPTTVSITLDGAGTKCDTAFTSTVDGNATSDQVVITEVPQDNWALLNIDIVRWLARGIWDKGGYVSPSLDDTHDVGNGRAVLYINGDMARTVTFTNDFTPPPPPPPPPSTGCTYTKGWYQNKNGSPTVIAVDGRTKAEAQAIFKATPGKPNGVSWQGGNNTLNLYQQLLAALNNVGGDIEKAPAAVKQAILDAQAATGGTGLNITLSAGANVGALTNTLASFNEGDFKGWPHCD